MALRAKMVGKITEEEKIEIRSLFSRKMGLEEIFKSLLVGQSEFKNVDLYNKLMSDYSEVVVSFKNWWDTKSAQYAWESADGGNWTVNFDTNEVFLNY